MSIINPPASVSGLNSVTTIVNVGAATAPTTGQVLTATSSTTATWQASAGGTPPSLNYLNYYNFGG